MSSDLLDEAIQAARAHWSAVGLDSNQQNALDVVEIHITSLPGSYLGLATSNSIWIDQDAAGYGWSTEFGSGGVDLVSAVTHEFGHVLDFDHHDEHEMMAARLAPAMRPLAEADFGGSGFSGVLGQQSVRRDHFFAVWGERVLSHGPRIRLSETDFETGSSLRDYAARLNNDVAGYDKRLERRRFSVLETESNELSDQLGDGILGRSGLRYR